MANQNEAFISIQEICCIDLRTSSSSVKPEQLPTNSPAFYNLGENIMLAIYAADEHLQRIIELVQLPRKTKVQILPVPWREIFFNHSFKNFGYLHIDDH